MRDSYRDVLENVNDNIDEVNQGRIRLESKISPLATKRGRLEDGARLLSQRKSPRNSLKNSQRRVRSLRPLKAKRKLRKS